ncbi:MAG: phosphoribosylaminoimidazolesuccinocarboxamide synthase [Candidatus Thermoplasmatota archaeon]|nr:phosphoribosylaminoimidazolesuccinocarboxamide synthase [Candidatus Thermoplasmatota archaeon]MBU1940405.1 phosphoribosylaminoimidazolesuccinocarboxamide synthase [Candidatus Thermoplasmatota archaeon]
MTTTIPTTDIPLSVISKGKVRDLYALDQHLLMIATDRISAFDYVLPDPIPLKGICLTQLSKFWFNKTTPIVPNHYLTTNIAKYPTDLQPYSSILKHRSMIVKKTKVIPIECIVRGYISGSAWKSYQKDGTVCGIKLQSGLKESTKFHEPLFTPSTKATTGHDINISYSQMKEIVGDDTATQLKDYSIKLYTNAAQYARQKGIIIADTKFEFGWYEDQVILIDEALTPDSSRFWPADHYTPGKPQPSFDKQYVRDYLISTGWDKNSNPPHLPTEVITTTQQKYQEVYERLTGKPFSFS